MPSYSAGSASVHIVPDFSGAQRDIKAWFARQGNQNVSVNADLNRSSLQAVSTQIEAHHSKINVDVDIHNAEEKLTKFLDTAMGFSQVSDVFRAVFGPRSILMTSGVGAFTALASSAAAALPVIGLLPAAIAAVAAPAAALMIGMQGVGKAFTAMGKSDATSAADSAAAAAKRDAAAQQVISAQNSLESAEHSLELAHRGVADAERHVAETQLATKVAQEGLTQARAVAVRTLQDMNMELARVALDEEAASLNVEKAQDRLNQVLAGSAQAAKLRQEATVQLNKAQAALSLTMADPGANQEDKAAAVQAVADAHSHLNDTVAQSSQTQSMAAREAELGVRQAKESLTEIQVKHARLATDTAKANQAGVEGQANVVAAHGAVNTAVQNQNQAVVALGDAQYRLADAQKGVVQATAALTRAQTDAAKSGKEMSASASAAATAMANLSPNAQQFVRAVLALKGAWKDMRFAIQDSLFYQLGPMLTELARTSLPTLKAGLSGIAAELNGGLRASMAVFMQPQVVKDFGTTLTNIRKAFANLTAAAAPLTHLFVDLTTVGSQFLPQLTAGFGKAATHFAAFISHARETGALAHSFQQALDTLKNFWTILRNLGSGLGGIFQAAFPAGQLLTKLLGVITGDLATFLHTDVGQSALGTFFNDIVGVLNTLQPALSALIDAAVTGLLPAISGLASALAPVANTLLVSFANMVKEIAPLIYPAMAQAVSAMLEALIPLMPVITEIAVQLFPVLAQILKDLAPIIAEFAEAVGQGVLETFQTLLPMLMPLATAFGFILHALTPFMPILVPMVIAVWALIRAYQAWTATSKFLKEAWKGLSDVWKSSPWLLIIGLIIIGLVALWSHSKTFRTIVHAVLHAVGEAAMWLWEKAIKPAWGFILGYWKLLAAGIKWYWDHVLHPVWNALVAVAKWLWGVILKPIFEAIKWYWGILATAIKWYWEHILKPVWTVIADVAKVLGRILVVLVFGAIKLAWLALSNGIKWVWEHILKPVWDAVETAAKWLWNHILKPIFDALGKAWDALFKGMKVVYDKVLDPLFTAFGKAAQAVATIFGGVVDGIKTAWDTIKEILATPINFVIEMIFNKGLFTAWNWAVDSLGLPKSWHAPVWKQIKEGHQFADGGTIPGSSPHDRADNVPIWATAGEFMQPVSAHRQYGTGFMEAVRSGRFPTELAQGYADGGEIWKVLDADRKKWFPGSVLTSGFRPGSPDYHGQGMAIDIGWPGNDYKHLDAIAARLLALAPNSAEIIHNPNASVKNGKQVSPSFWGSEVWRAHMNHVHWAVSNLSQLVGVDGAKLQQGGIGGVWSRLLNSVTGPMKTFAAKFGNNKFLQEIGGAPKHLLTGIWDATVGRIKEFFTTFATNATTDNWGTGKGTDPSKIKSGARTAMRSFGFTSDADWNALDQLVAHESSWNPKAKNPTSSASGLFQLIDSTWRADRTNMASKYAHAMDAPVGDQLTAGLTYIQDRYGSPSAAWAKWQSRSPHWYDQGGYLPPGLTTVMNATGRPEPVLTAAEHDGLLRWRSMNRTKASDGPTTVAGFVNNGTVLTTDLDELARKSRVGTARALLAAGL